MKTSKKLLSTLIAFLMLFAITPSAIAKAAEPTETTVILTKVIIPDTTNITRNGTYDGSQLSDITSYFGSGAKTATGVVFTIKNSAGQYVNNVGAVVTEPYYFTTDASGQISAKLPNGTYTIDEIKDKSTYIGPNGEQLTGSAAIPMTLTLPMVKADGTYFDINNPLYVYPKNSEDKPTIVKEGDTGAGYDRTSNIGDKVPYVVTTTVPVNASYATFNWEDTMTAGLTYNRDLVISTTGEALAEGTDYTLLQTNNGFSVFLTQAGLDKINNKATVQTITLKYSATVNDAAVVDVAEKNTILLNYGNQPTQNSTTVTAQNNQISIAKTWANGTPPSGVKAIFDIYDGTTFVKTVELDGTVDATETTAWSAVVTGLETGKVYTVVERTVSGYTPEYSTNNTNGTVTVNNAITPNPNPLTPQPVESITYGKKFVKIEQGTTTRLAGAVFEVTKTINGVTNYLTLKDTTTQAAEITAYQDAEKAYQDAVAAKAPADEIASLKATRDAAYVAMNMQWIWQTNEASAFKFTSDANGAFEVVGLEEGTYNLVETVAPTGYAKLTSPISFAVGPNTYSTGDIAYTPGEALDAQSVNNVKVTIPQTGGIGTTIFTLVGISVMGLALIAMKRRNRLANEEE